MDRDLQIVGLGLATLDVLIRLRDMPTWEQGVPIESFRFDGGGLVGTAIVAAAKLGARTGFIGTAGGNDAADLKMRSMVEAGVDLRHLVRRPGLEDQVMLVAVHADTGERTFSSLRGMRDHPLRVEELDRDYIVSADTLHLDGFHAEAALQAAKWMKEAGGTVVLDGSTARGSVRAHLVALLPFVDVLITGVGFAEALTGVSDIWRAGAGVLERGPTIFVETRGSEGCYTVTADQRFHTPTFEVDVVDTTGAGDVFHGAYIVGLLQGWDLRTVARFASAVSAIKCTQLGGRVGIPTFEETVAFLGDRGISIEE